MPLGPKDTNTQLFICSKKTLIRNCSFAPKEASQGGAKAENVQNAAEGKCDGLWNGRCLGGTQGALKLRTMQGVSRWLS